jgi:hypothetical protein
MFFLYFRRHFPNSIWLDALGFSLDHREIGLNQSISPGGGCCSGAFVTKSDGLAVGTMGGDRNLRRAEMEIG